MPSGSRSVRAWALAFLVVASAAVAGCFGIYAAEVPAEYLTDGWQRTDSGGGEKWLGLAAEWVHVTYQVDPPRSGTLDDGPYAASLTVMTIDTAERLKRDDVAERLDEQVRDNAAAQGIRIDEASKVVGERTLESGVRSLYFTYRAEIAGSSALFDQGRDARVLGEVWYDEPEGTTVIVVGLAQVQGGGAAGRYFVDGSNWDRIVADPNGSIEGRTGTNGLVYNVRSHP